jgi:hypothetical protein
MPEWRIHSSKKVFHGGEASRRLQVRKGNAQMRQSRRPWWVIGSKLSTPSRRIGRYLAVAAAVLVVGCGRAGSQQATPPPTGIVPVGAGDGATPPTVVSTAAGVAPAPTVGPCGFVNCSTAQREGARASCDETTFDQLVTNQIDGSIDIGGSACDGNYLVLDIGHRTCASTGPTPCVTALGLAFFVAQNGAWSLVTYGQSMTCASVAKTMEQPKLPAQLCTEALAS